MAVVGVEIEQRAVVLDDHTFGAAGAYEKLAGVVRFAVDRANPANHAITDLGLAPANARGHVEFLADFHLPTRTVTPEDARARAPGRGGGGAASEGVGGGRGGSPVAPCLRVENGLGRGNISEPLSRAATPPLVGLGFLAVRDTAAWLRCA